MYLPLPRRCAIPLVGLVFLGSVAGCDAPADRDEKPSTGDSGAGEDSAHDTVPLEDPVSPCEDGSWGSILPLDAVHVGAGGVSGATGTYDDPVGSLQEALDLSRSAGTRMIFVGPGRFEDTAVELWDAEGDDGLTIEGCGAETVLAGEGEPIVRASGITLRIARLAAEGGLPTLYLQQGATTVLDTLDLSGGTGAIIIGDGHDTFTTLSRVTLTDPVPLDELGIGLLSVDGTIDATTVTVSGATGVGILASGSGDAGEAVLSDVMVTDTATTATSGTLGRGIQLQDLATATLASTWVTSSVDAGVYVQLVGTLDITTLHVETVSAGTAADSGSATGDGVVVTGSDGTSASYDPALFVATLDGVEVDGAVRAGILVERATAALSGSAVSGGTASIYAQDGAVVTGDAVDAFTTTFDLNREVVDVQEILDALPE